MSETIEDRHPLDEREQLSDVKAWGNSLVHVLGTGRAAAAVAIALSRAGLIEWKDFVVHPDGCKGAEDTGKPSHGATPRVVSISYEPEGANLKLITSAGTIAARNIVIANDAIWQASGYPANRAKLSGSPVTGSPVPGLFTVGFPDGARRSEQFTLDAAATRIATLIEQRK